MTSVNTDNLGHVILGGNFNGEVDFNPESSQQIHITANSLPNGFIEKVNSQGEFLWMGEVESSSVVFCDDLTIDNQNNILLYGEFQGTADFDIFSGIHQETATYSDVFISTYTSEGEFSEFFKYDSPNGDAVSIEYSQEEQLYVVGNFMDSIDIDLGANVEMLYSEGGTDCFVSKLGYTLSIADQSTIFKVNAYPNPFTSGIQIVSKYQIQNIKIYTINGVLIDDLFPYSEKFEIQTKEYKKGIYIVEINSNRGTRIIKMVKN
jgi:hypothetical protein